MSWTATRLRTMKATIAARATRMERRKVRTRGWVTAVIPVSSPAGSCCHRGVPRPADTGSTRSQPDSNRRLPLCRRSPHHSGMRSCIQQRAGGRIRTCSAKAPGLQPGPTLQRRRARVACHHAVPSARLERAPLASSTPGLCQLGYEGSERSQKQKSRLSRTSGAAAREHERRSAAPPVRGEIKARTQHGRDLLIAGSCA